jgi:hypothetical protein
VVPKAPVSILQAIIESFGKDNVISDVANDIDQAVAVAKSADIAIVVLAQVRSLPTSPTLARISTATGVVVGQTSHLVITSPRSSHRKRMRTE